MGEEKKVESNSKFKSRTFWWGVGISLITVAGMITGKTGWTEGLTILTAIFTGFKAFDTLGKRNNNNLINKVPEEVKK